MIIKKIKQFLFQTDIPFILCSVYTLVLQLVFYKTMLYYAFSLYLILRIIFISIIFYLILKLAFTKRWSKILIIIIFILANLITIFSLIHYYYFLEPPSLLTFQLGGQGKSIIAQIILLFDIKLTIFFTLLLLLSLLLLFTKTQSLKRKTRIIIPFSILLIILIQIVAVKNISQNIFMPYPRYRFVHDYGYIPYIIKQYYKYITEVDYTSHLPNPLKGTFTSKTTNKEGNKSNFIIIQVESLDNSILDKKFNGEEVTPFINSLKKQHIYCSNFFAQHTTGGSSDAEFSSITGLLPLSDTPTFNFHQLTHLPSVIKILNSYGYKAYAFHGNIGSFWNRINSYKALGFEKFYDEEYYSGLKVFILLKGFHSLDARFFNQSIPFVETISKNEQPYLLYFITQSMHGPYINKPIFPFNKNFKTNNKELENYLRVAKYTDMSLGYFFQELTNKDLLKNTNIIIFGDHTTGIKTDEYSSHKDIKENVPLIIIPANRNIKGIINTYSSHTDIPQTILNLADINESEEMIGRSLLNWIPNRLFPVKVAFTDFVISPFDTMPIADSINPLYREIINYCKSFFYRIDATKEINSNILLKTNCIAHALGSIDDIDYTNSKEAFLRSYALGIRIMETDLLLLKDGNIACSHNMYPPYQYVKNLTHSVAGMSTEEFLSYKLYNKYTPLSIENLLSLLRLHKDCFIITDFYTKFNPTLLNLVKIINKYDKTLFNRFFIQIYNTTQLETIKRLSPFKNIILTLYKTEMSDKEVFNFVNENRDYIKAVTISKKRFSSELSISLQKIKIPTFVHTVNNEKEMFKYIKNGAFGFYTDAPSNLLNVIKNESY